MEVTTVSPSPASPTEGDDLCETDVTKVAIHSVTLLICLCGLAGNVPGLCILNISFTTDFNFTSGCHSLPLSPPGAPIHTAPPLEDVSCSAVVSLGSLSFFFQLSLLCSRVGLHRVVFMSITGFGSAALNWFCCRSCFFPECLPCVVMSALLWTFFAVIPLNPTVAFLCQFHEELCQVPLISMYTLHLLLFAPFMLISSVFLCIQDTGCSGNSKPKELHIVIFLSLILLPLSLWSFLQQLSYTILLFLLEGINNTIRPFIYFLVGRCWKNCSVGSLRELLRRVFGEPEENTASSSNDHPQGHGGLSVSIPSTALMKHRDSG